MRNNNSVAIILILVIVLGLMVGVTREAAKTDKVEMTNSETLTEVEELNSEVDDLFTNVIKMRFYDKVEKGEITEEMLETLTSEEIFMIVMSD